MYPGFHVKCTACLSDFQELELSRQILIKLLSVNNNFTEIRLVGAELFRADRHTDSPIYMTKLIIAFRVFANAPKTNHVHCRYEHQTIFNVFPT
jgi:hypothetical protein